MTNPIALVLSLIVVAAILADVIFNGSQFTIYAGRVFLDVIQWIAFWR